MCGCRSEVWRTGSQFHSQRVCAAPRWLIAGVALLAVSALDGCAKRTPAESKPSTQVLRISQRNEPADLDPATTSLPDEFGILRALLEGLLIPGENGGEPQPGAAERWEVSADGLVYTFHLRAGLWWSNGEPLTARDFVAAYRRLLSPSTAAPKATAFYPVKNARAFASGRISGFDEVGVRATDDRTVVITLEQPTPRFPYYVASGPWLPVHVPTVERHGRKWTTPEFYVGNGPFTLSEWRPHQRIVVKKNPRSHRSGGVRLDEIHFVHFDNGDTEERAYRAGQIDVTMAVPATKLEVYARERPTELHRRPMIETRYLSFNTRRAPLNDVRLRRALAAAIDRAALVERVVRGGLPATGRLIPPALRGTTADGVREQRHDPAQARQLLAATGVAVDSLRPLELTAWSSSQTPVLEAIQAMWQRELGVRSTIAIREAKVHLAALASGDYDVGFITAIPDVADAFEILDDFVTGAPENYPQWTDPAFDQGIQAARVLAEPVPRAAALARLEDRLVDETPLSPLYHNAKIWLMAPRVHGWQEDGLWSRCYHTVFLDEQ